MRRISKELGCCKSTVRKKLFEAGIDLVDQNCDEHKALRKKIQVMRERGLSYQSIANFLTYGKLPHEQVMSGGILKQSEK